MRVRPETAEAVMRVSYKFSYHPTLDDVRILENRIRDLEESTKERRLIIKGWKIGDYHHPGKRREFTSVQSFATQDSLEAERARIGEDVADWQPHITEVYMEEREVTEWRKVDL